MAYIFPHIPLTTTYSNDVLDEDSNTNVVYIMTDLADNSTKNITLQDATVYETLGDSLDSTVINNTNEAVNAIADKVEVNRGNIETNATYIANHATAIGLLQDGEIDLDTTAAAGTTDGDLYGAITALGWENDVID